MGDLVLVIDNDIIKEGIDRDAVLVMDVDDKVTTLDEEDNEENRIAVTLRTMTNMIGEYSNYSSVYHNKRPKTDTQKKKYESYIDILSVLTGKAIDYAKTGVMYNVPRHIAKYGQPLPYFMKYRSDYYKRKKLSRATSNMNRLCWEIEKWSKQHVWKRTSPKFDYKIMIDESVPVDDEIFNKIEEVFLRYCKEIAALKRDEISIQMEKREFSLAWDIYYEKYRNECNSICNNNKLLANIVVILCYEKYPNRSKKFIWKVAGTGIVENIKQVSFQIPIRDNNGTEKYLGKNYSLVPYLGGIRESKEFEYSDEYNYEEWLIFD